MAAAASSAARGAVRAAASGGDGRSGGASGGAGGGGGGGGNGAGVAEPLAARGSVVRLGNLGRLLRIEVPQPSADGAAAGRRAQAQEEVKYIAVVDVSGSMGQTVPAVLSRGLPTALERLGVPLSQPVDIITFTSDTKHERKTIPQLRSWGIKAQASTFMHDAVGATVNLLCAHPRAPVRLIVVSDGEIGDSDRVLSLAATISARLDKAGRVGSTQVALLRLLTSRSASPDTRAMACLGQVNTDGVVYPFDIVCYNGGDFGAGEVATRLAEAFAGSTVTATLACAGARRAGCFWRVPGEEPKVELQLRTGSSLVFVADDVDVQQLTLDGRPLPVRDAPLRGENDVHELLVFLEGHVRQLLVMGNAADRVSKVMQWARGVSHVLETLEAKEQELPLANRSEALRARRVALEKLVQKRTKSAIQRLLALANEDRVNALNAQRQADFLRGVQDSAQGRAVARRAAKVDSEDPNEVALACIAQLRAAKDAEPLPAGAEELVSFFSRCSLRDSLVEVKQLSPATAESLDASDALQLVGALGVSFFADQQAAPDPWAFRVKCVNVGESSLLLQSDLWVSRLQGGNTRALRAPATAVDITGVLPLRCVDPAAYDVFVGAAMKLNLLHVGCSMRNAMVCMPYDLAALRTAAALALVRDMPAECNEAYAQTLLWVLHDHHHAMRSGGLRALFGELEPFLCSNDPRPYLAGDLNIASNLKPLAVLLGAPLAAEFLARPGPLLRAMLGFEAYLSASAAFPERPQRTAALHRVLGIDLAKHATPLAPLFEPDAKEPRHHDAFDSVALAAPAADAVRLYTPTRAFVDAVAVRLAFERLSALSPAHASAKRFAVLLNEERSRLRDQQTLGVECSVDQLECVVRLQALLAPDLASRVEIEGAPSGVAAAAPGGPGAGRPPATAAAAPSPLQARRVYRFPDVTSEAQFRAFVTACVRDVYRADYEERLAEKRKREAELRVQRLVDDLARCPSVETFVRLLRAADEGGGDEASAEDSEAKAEQGPVQDKVGMQSRSSPGFAELLARLMDRNEPVPQRLPKLWVLALGRNRRGEPVWCQGNVMRNGLNELKPVFEAVPLGADLFAELMSVARANRRHVYRDMPNRHGYDNDNPSWFARGYDSKDSFRISEPEEYERAERARVHR